MDPREHSGSNPDACKHGSLKSSACLAVLTDVLNVSTLYYCIRVRTMSRIVKRKVEGQQGTAAETDDDSSDVGAPAKLVKPFSLTQKSKKRSRRGLVYTIAS